MPEVTPMQDEDDDGQRGSQPELDLERCAELVALLAHFKHASRSDVLDRLRVDQGSFDRSREHWMSAIGDELERDDDALARRYGEAFARKKAELAATTPSLDALGPRSLQSVAAVDEKPDRAGMQLLPREKAPRAEQPPLPSPDAALPAVTESVPGRAPSEVQVPSYLLAPPPPAASPDETVVGGGPAGRALPFQDGAPVVAPPARPVEAAADSGGTVLAPVPAEVRRLVAAIPAPAAFDPDVTLPPVAAKAPTLPFSGETTPERLQQIAGPPRLEPAPDAGETAMMPVPEDVRALVMAVLQAKDDLPLPEYAAMRAQLIAQGEDDETVLSRFGLTKVSKEKVQQRYFARFREDPALRERFEALVREEIRKSNRG